jgi:peptidoglycan hydrolase CwlO-like protein
MKGQNKNQAMLFLLTGLIPACFIFFQSGAILTVKASDEEIKEDISDVQDKIKEEEKEKAKLEQELSQIQGSVSRTQQEINKTQSYVNKTGETISRKENEIENLGNKIEFQKKILGSLLREMYYDGSSPELIMTLEAEKFSQFLGGADHLAAVQQKILNLMGEIKYSKEEIEKNKNELKDNQDEQERLLALKQDQQQDLMATRNETQSDINEKEATISELNAKLWKLQGDLSGFLGKSYNAKDIEDAARFASKATGVRKDFIMGMLVVESDLGRFTGGCLAKDSRMSGRRLDLFKDICEELDYNWKKRKVSCPPKGYSGTGGAMGVAQFMSDTWMGYKSQIASVTGHKPPDPWNLTDGVTAMGLKLARGGATKKSGECNAAKLYLSGTTSSKYNWYCQKVLYWADNYERLID